jgi:hypothetical protein
VPFLHWLRSGNPIDAIAAAFKLPDRTLYTRKLEVVDRVHDSLVTRFLTAQACALLPLCEEYPACGFTVDATIHNRGRPVGTFEEGKRYFSGKHKLYCLKSQVIANRNGLAVHIVAGVPGAKPDFQLFQDDLAAIEELVASHPGERSHILADKGYTGDMGSGTVVLVIPHKARPGVPLGPHERRENAVLSRNRVIVENFFGRLQGKFAIMCVGELRPPIAGWAPAAVRGRNILPEAPDGLEQAS